MQPADRSFTGTFVCDGEGWVRTCNQRLAAMLGCPTSEAAVGTNLLSFFVTARAGGRFLRRLRAARILTSEEVRWRVPERGDLYLLLNAEAVIGDFGEVLEFFGEVLDITPRKQLAEQVAHLQRVASVGQLASGVAHDFNNILSIITGYADLLLDEAGNHPELRPLLEEITRAAERGAGLTRHLLSFTRKRPSHPTVVDLNEMITGLQKMMNRLVGENIRLVSECATGVHPVRADLGQLEHVVINLVINARDAMPAGGQISISTRNTSVTSTIRTCHDTVAAGEYAVLSIRDAGVGMDTRVLTRIFEPFFTTKQEGHGTGLGLANSFRLIKEFGGSALVLSEPGVGTTFEIYLPRCADEPAESGPGEPVRPMRGSETVLLVEDDDYVRQTVFRILSVNGYRVVQAGSAEEAIKLADEQDRPIHLLLTDVVLPGMNGPQLATDLTHRRPELSVLFISGYTDSAAELYGLARGNSNFLPKPFTIVELASKVREVLDGAIAHR